MKEEKKEVYRVGDIISVEREIGIERMIVTKVGDKEIWARHDSWQIASSS